MFSQSSLRLERIANLTSLAVAALFALTIPAGYFAVEYSHTRQLLQDQADVAADAISKLIYQQPDFWVYQEHRLQDMVASSNWRHTPRNYQVSNDEDEVIVEVGQTIAIPYLRASADLTDGERRVGNVQVVESLKPLLHTTLLVSLFGALLAWLIHYVLKVLPFAALRKVMDSLNASQQQLETEVSAKQRALQEATALSDRMLYQAMHDALTELPNRTFFNQHAETALAAASADSRLAVLMLDLNRFKEINDSLGHHAGDEVLKEVSLRIHEMLHQRAFIARLGGDEFAALLQLQTCAEAREIAEGINKTLHHHMVLDGYHIAVQASIGIACYPEHGATVDGLMRRADVAMYQAKASGDLICFYDEALDASSPSRLTLAADLRHAVDCGGLHLLYQPKVALDSGQVRGVEALARWQHPEYGFISPDVFIPLAEESGMIHDLTKTVLRCALSQLSEWRTKGIMLNVAVNISPRNLQDDGLIGFIQAIADEYGVTPAELTLEVTESSIMIDPDKAQQQIATLSDWGARIAIDDFGTGYSSLAYLKRLRVDELKIDKSFIHNMLEDDEDKVIVRSTIELAHNLGMRVVAEGIENQGTADLLQTFGCEVGQGFHYSHPVEAAHLSDRLMENPLIRTRSGGSA